MSMKKDYNNNMYKEGFYEKNIIYDVDNEHCLDGVYDIVKEG